MRTALKAPLHNIPDNILNRVVSKSIQADLRKYKMGTKAERYTREKNQGVRTYANEYNSTFDVAVNTGDLSRDISALLGDLNSSCSNKNSLIKM